ncbi:alpha/beta hydrolase [Plantactinospora sp. WMMC1484]|uniref:alpha/beta hydrolase n=1 Tax=Plantactinospora sp. WMMC1484 TaxID=3404122 RepID=UPI003BF5839E
MVTQDAGGHGVYGIRSGPCAAEIATTFLTTGRLPDRHRRCPGPSPDDIGHGATRSAAVPHPASRTGGRETDGWPRVCYR